MNRNWNTYISKKRPFSDFFWTWNIEKQKKKLLPLYYDIPVFDFVKK